MQREISSMVESQVSRLISQGFTYQQIFNAIWYFETIKDKPISSEIDKYGIGLLSSVPKNMEEALNYFKRLAKTRERAFISAEKSKKSKKEEVIIERQKRKIIREEFNWDE